MNPQITTPKIADLYGPILDAIPDMLVLFSPNTVVLDLIHPKVELISSPPEELTGCKLTEEQMKSMTGIGLEQLNTVLHDRQSQRVVFTHKGVQDHRTHYYETSLSCLKTGHALAIIHTIDEECVKPIESKHLHYFFAEVLDNIAIPVSVKSMDSERYVYWGKKAELFGRTASEMIGETEELYMPLEQARKIQAIDRKLLEGPENQYQGIEKYTVNDGKEHTLLITRTLFTFGGEKLILSSALDISELTETQSSLLQTKHELAHKNMILYSALSLAKVIPWGCDLINHTFYCDYNAYHPDNANKPDALGRYVIPLAHYFDGIHPENRQEAVQMIKELAEDRLQEFHETYRVHWFNNQKWEWVQIQCCISQRDAHGRPVALIGSAQRVTEQKETELALCRAKEELNLKNSMLSSVLDIAQIIPWSGNLKERTLSCPYEIYHPDNAQEPDENGNYTISVEEYLTRIHPDYRSNANDLFSDLMEGNISEFHDIYPIHWYNDEEYEWLEIQSSTPQYGVDDKPVLLVGSARIITAQKQSEDSLRKAKEQAEQSNLLKSTFLANMSHEIRTPLNSIVGFSELLAQAEDEEEKKEYFSIIQNSNALLLQLIGDILDLSRIEAGTLNFTYGDHDLNALMEELAQTARMKITNPAVEVACTHQIPHCTIHTDQGRLLQVLHNFINNAAKFTQQGHIHFGYRKHADGRWYFYVEDTGCGIASDKIDTVFERFVKLDSMAKGTGLGLAISKSIIERLGGEIGVYSAEGQGSTFWFLLPAECITSLAPVVPTREETPPKPIGTKPAQVTLLIAEDDPTNYKLFEAMLKKHYTLLHAWNGREAVEMFKKHHPSMILMDIKMPEMDGYKATAAIRNLSKDIPIVAVTAFAYPEDMRRILSSGFNGCLPKPVSTDNLKKKISELCPYLT